MHGPKACCVLEIVDGDLKKGKCGKQVKLDFKDEKCLCGGLKKYKSQIYYSQPDNKKTCLPGAKCDGDSVGDNNCGINCVN